MKKKSIFVSAVLLMCSPFAFAGDDPAPFIPAEEPRSDFSEGWEFELTPYGWMSGMEGVLGVNGLTAPIDLGFDDILEDLDAGAMLAFDARKDRYGFIFEGLWVKISDRADTSGDAFSQAKVTVNEVILNGSLYYRAVEDPYTLDLLAGARYVYMDTELEFSPGRLPGRSIDGSKDWIDPVVGFRASFSISEKLTGVVLADIGGFGVSSDLTWQAYLGLNYKLSESTQLKLGWRHLEIDYDRSDFSADLEMDGMTIGLGWSF